MSDYSLLHLEEGEKVILEVRKHWIVFVGHIISTCFLALVPVIAYILLLDYVANIYQFITGQFFHYFLFFYVLWLLFLWIGFFLSWTTFFLDVWYVTETRIIAIEQEGFFHRVVSNLRFDRVQDITVDINGLMATFLNFGNIRVQTASESEADFFISVVKDPENVKKIIFAQHNFISNQPEKMISQNP